MTGFIAVLIGLLVVCLCIAIFYDRQSMTTRQQ